MFYEIAEYLFDDGQVPRPSEGQSWILTLEIRRSWASVDRRENGELGRLWCNRAGTSSIRDILLQPPNAALSGGFDVGRSDFSDANAQRLGFLSISSCLSKCSVSGDG